MLPTRQGKRRARQPGTIFQRPVPRATVQWLLLEARKKELTELVADIPEDVSDLLPSASTVYAKKVAVHTGALGRTSGRKRRGPADVDREDRPDAGIETWNDSRHAARRNCAPFWIGPISKPIERLKNKTPGGVQAGVSSLVVRGDRACFVMIAA